MSDDERAYFSVFHSTIGKHTVFKNDEIIIMQRVTFVKTLVKFRKNSTYKSPQAH